MPAVSEQEEFEFRRRAEHEALGARTPAAPKAKPNIVKDVAKSGGSGVLRGGASLIDMAAQATPVGVLQSTLATAADFADTLGETWKGRRRVASPTAPISGNTRGADKVAHKPQTWQGELAETVGEFAPNLIAPGSMGRRAVNWLVPALASEGAGRAARGVGASPEVETAARTGGALLGAGGASVNPRNALTGRGRATPGERMAARTRQDPAAMRERAEAFRRSGVDPTLADVVDDTGRGMIRAAANRPTPARQVANDFARRRALDLPDRMSGQARRSMSADPRTPDQIRTEMTAARGAHADEAFGAVRGDIVQLAPEGIQALRTDYGRAAIREAARRERDPEARAALNRLAEAALDSPSTPVTVGMADRVSRVLLGQAQEAGRRGDNDLAATLGGLGRSVRGPTAEASPGYRQALDDYGADTRLTEAAGVGEGLMRRNTDEFAAEAERLLPEERQLALAAGRRAVERAAGENPASAPGVARRLADAPEQQARNRALLGPEGAEALQDGMRAEVQAVDNAQAIAPRSGSSTFLNAADEGNLSQAAGAVTDAFRGRWGSLLGRALDAWRSRGMNDQQVEELVRMSVDPAQAQQALQLITQRLGPQAAREYLSWRNAALVGALGATGARSSTPEESQPR